ncbi:hypothetical protein [Streptomyces sp. NBC_01244]|uniref:hypothetical protein n=1 Tax=Streptomyces sp. NBC_01244 TaxID=2903797 RepID=UPI002E10DB58
MSIRARTARLLGRDRVEAEAIEGELEESRTELTHAREAGNPQPTLDMLEEEWRGRMRRTLRTNPEVAAHLRALLAEITPSQEAASGTAHNNITGTVHGHTVQAHTITGGVTFTTTPPPQH